jgi:hypothetical protein
VPNQVVLGRAGSAGGPLTPPVGEGGAAEEAARECSPERAAWRGAAESTAVVGTSRGSL